MSPKKPTWIVKANKNSETQAWWNNVANIFLNYPDSIPDAIDPLIDPQWSETAIMATNEDVRHIQAWATGIDGWITRNSPLSFEKT